VTMYSLSSLPYQALGDIFSWLTPNDLDHISLVCKELNKAVKICYPKKAQQIEQCWAIRNASLLGIWNSSYVPNLFIGRDGRAYGWRYIEESGDQQSEKMCRICRYFPDGSQRALLDVKVSGDPQFYSSEDGSKAKRWVTLPKTQGVQVWQLNDDDSSSLLVSFEGATNLMTKVCHIGSCAIISFDQKARGSLQDKIVCYFPERKSCYVRQLQQANNKYSLQAITSTDKGGILTLYKYKENSMRIYYLSRSSNFANFLEFDFKLHLGKELEAGDITSYLVHGDFLYIGTDRGKVLVVKHCTMKHIATINLPSTVRVKDLAVIDAKLVVTCSKVEWKAFLRNM